MVVLGRFYRRDAMLEVMLYKVICSGLAEANAGNVFISKADAMRAINEARKVLAVQLISIRN